MSAALQINSDGDTVLDSAGRIKTVSGGDKIVQDLIILLRSVKGSCPFDTTFGTEDLSGYHGSGTKLLETALKSALLQHDEVSNVQNFEIGKDGRTVNVSLTVQLIDGSSVSLEVEL